MTIRYADITLIMENSSGSPHPRVDVVETPVAQQDPDRARADLEVALYPDRLERGAAPISLTPSQAVRYADDPTRAEEAARTAGSRQVVEHVSIAALWSESGALGERAAPTRSSGVDAGAPAHADLEVAMPAPGSGTPPERHRPAAAAAARHTEGDRSVEAGADPSAPARHQPAPSTAPDGRPVAHPTADPEGAPVLDGSVGGDAAPTDVEDVRDAGQPWYAAAASGARRPWWRRLLGRRG